MNDVLVVIDMQNDFVSGSLGTKEAQAIVQNAVKKIESFKGHIVFTQDTHSNSYLQSQEGRFLPVQHCIKNTAGWELVEPVKKLIIGQVYEKPTFGSLSLAEALKNLNKKTPIHSITLIGLCTDICVVSNALLLKAFFPEVPIHVDAACCAGTTPENHKAALQVMRMCQIIIENE
ncbi:cysteine hydrolase family protein [Treponema vincentii]|jgi:amidase|uniref:cysteine hydrolase family protein n=1 Tax=Treponema vincentii TaxID=69710 RepID=UPI0035F5BFD7